MDYKEDLRKKLTELKQIEGFPIGEDEDIINLSNPPFYTACPNPYIKEFIEKNGTTYNEESDDYHKEPFVNDQQFGRNDPLLNAHFYHTKVPPKAIEEYIKHYTNKDDIVLDAFSGTGTTGVAARRSSRNAILFDLSPIATFISANQNTSFNSTRFLERVNSIISNVLEKWGWLYKSKLRKSEQDINYSIWSDIYFCPHCNTEFSYFDKFVDFENSKKIKEPHCSNCDALITDDNDFKKFHDEFDTVLNKSISIPKQKLELICFIDKNKKKYKKPDAEDLEVIRKIEEAKFPNWAPSNKMMFQDDKWGDQWRAGYHKGYTHTHLFYTKRNLLILSEIYNEVQKAPEEDRMNLLFLFTSLYSRSHRMNRYIPEHTRHVGPLSGTLYISSLQVEINIFSLLINKAKSLNKALSELKTNKVCISNQSATNLSNVESNTIDYIYTDPPFGDNLLYSELNFILEDWLKVHTRQNKEAIISEAQNKRVDEYHNLISETFKEYYRVLKPKRWITIVFHNSKSAVWNVIQDSIAKAGFVISNVSVLDKKKGTTKQLSYSGAVKNDLVISAFKPSKSFENSFLEKSGYGMEMSFVELFLKNQIVQPTIERSKQMLFSKYISYYLKNNFDIQLNSHQFYNLLKENFIEEDGYWFTSNQINSYVEYKKKLHLEGIEEVKSGAMMLFVSDEKSALIWLYNYLDSPKTYSDIHPAYTQIANIQGDNVPELSQLLEDNFVKQNNVYRRPTSEEEHNTLNTKREKVLMREFESLLLRAKSERKKIKEVRKEALVHGFEQCYKDKRFKDILTLEERLDKKIIENSSELNDFVEAAKIMVEGIN